MTSPGSLRPGFPLFLILLLLILPATLLVAQTGTTDFDGDGHGDILWRNSRTGQVGIWLMSGATVLSSPAGIFVGDLNWKTFGVGDFNGDTKADIVWQNRRTGQVGVWLMDGANVVSSPSGPTVADLNWQIVGVGDFNGDSRADLLWQNRKTGQVGVWLMDGASVLSSPSGPVVADLNWQVYGIGDFNGDHKADIVWQHRGSGQVGIWLMDGASVLSSPTGPIVADLNWQIYGVKDLNADTKADIVWQNRKTGQVGIWLMDGATVLSSPAGPTVADKNWQIFSVSDLSANGKGDIVWQNRETGQVGVWVMDGATVLSSPPGPTVSDPDWKISSAAVVPHVEPPSTTSTFLAATIPSSVLPNSFSWDVTLNHGNNTFHLVNRSQNYTYSGTMVALNTGFLKLTTTMSDDPLLPLPAHGYALEIPNTMVLARLTDSNSLVAVLTQVSPCPQLTSTISFNEVEAFLEDTWDSADNSAYAVRQVGQSGSGYVTSSTQYRLDGTPTNSGTDTSSCAGGLYYTPPPPSPPQIVATFAPTGVVLGTAAMGTRNRGSILLPVPSNPVNLAIVAGAQYRGMIFRPRSAATTLQFVGFGPGNGNSISGGGWNAIDSDAFGTHASDVTLNLNTQPSNGLIKGTLVDGKGTHSPFVGEVAQIGGKYILFGLTTDASSTQPYEIFLVER